MHTAHVKYDLMDYVTNRLGAKERKRVEQHLQKCTMCNNQFIELSAAYIMLKQSHDIAPTPTYYSTILPRVRERLAAHKRSVWNSTNNAAKIILPIAVSVLLVIILIRISTDSFSESAQIEALHQTVIDLDEYEVLQAIELEYNESVLSPNQEVAAAGVAEHLHGDQFLKSALSKQIENEDISGMDIEVMISDLDGEQVDKVLFGLSERDVI